MKALLIAGGFGTRLRPLTLTRPKHLLPIALKPHIVHVFDLLVRHGIEDVALLTSYLADRFEEVVRQARERGLRVEVIHETDPLGTAGAIKNAASFIGDDPFVAMNGDILTTLDLGAAIGFHRDRSAEVTIVLTPVEDPSAYGVVPTDDEGRVQGFIEKPPPGTASTNLINAGVYVMEASVLEHIPEGVAHSAERGLFPGLVETGERVFALATDAYWMDIGTPAKYLQANLDALAGHLPGGTVTGGIAVAGDARISDEATVGSACIGPGCVVGRGAVVERSVLLPGVQVGQNARVVGTIAGEGVSIAAGTAVEGATLADGSVVAESLTGGEAESLTGG